MATDASFGLIQTAWLFTRGSQSVRIVRMANADGHIRLLVQGPGPLAANFDFNDTIVCMTYQAEIERNVVADGFQFVPLTTERRNGLDRRRARRGPDRRAWSR